MVDLPSAQDCIAAATKLWGKPSSRTRNEVRWGAHGSKKLDISDPDHPLFFDNEAGEGYGAIELCRRAGTWQPNGRARPNGQTRDGFLRTHDYVDEVGKLIFQVCKKPDGSWTQRRPNGNGGFEWNLKGVNRVLYRLPALIRADPRATVYITEGEKDADNLARLGVVATTNPGGAGKWRPEYSGFLRARHVVILPDHDSAGTKHAAEITMALSGIAASVLTVALPFLANKQDVTDWIAAGGDLKQLEALIAEAKGEPQPWSNLYQLEGRKPLSNLVNARIALANHPRLARCFKYDEMERALMSCRSGELRDVDEVDIILAQEQMQLAGLKRIGKNTVYDAVLAYAKEHLAYHPVKDYFKTLTWDGKPRVDTFASDYLDAQPTDYNHVIGRLFLISMVARIFQPGCKADHMMILEGEQGTYKSTACRVLAGREQWFSDALPDIAADKDVSLHLRGRWIVEIQEMHAFSRAAATRLKSFLATTVERFRPPYSHAEVTEPRQCVFAGTSNKDNYLSDETGGRRFWPIKTGLINLDALRHDRDQLLAEAKHLYDDGAPWWPDPAFEAEHIKPQQDARYEPDAWEDAIRDHVAMLTRVTTAQIAGDCLHIPLDRRDKSTQMRIAAILANRIGWQRKRSNSAKWWEKPT